VTPARFTVKFWGTRGSVATPGASTVRCGGNTPCIEVRCDARIIILDAGTGIRLLGLELERQGVKRADLLITHPHMDHLQGFPFFTPAYHASTSLTVYMAPLGDEDDPSQPFRRLMGEPNFPVIFHDLPARIRVHRLNGEQALGEVTVKLHPTNHPGGCYAYRLEYGGKSLVYMTDHEPYYRMFSGLGDSAEKDRAVREFLRGADLLVRETQYTEEEYPFHRGWGHGTFEDALCDALDNGVRRLALFHHDPEHDDAFLENQLAELQARKGNADLEILLAREGQSIELL